MKKNKSGNELLLISYVPFLDPQESTPDLIMKSIRQLPGSGIIGCAWMEQDGEQMPVLVCDRAQELASHLRFWSEDRPQDWFELHWAKDQDDYAIVLMPRIERTRERFLMGYQLRTGYPYPPNSTIRVYCEPLHFHSKRPDMRLDQSVTVSLLDRSHTTDKIDLDTLRHRIELGRFPCVASSDTARQYLRQ
jgi:hypothetical protein